MVGLQVMNPMAKIRKKITKHIQGNILQTVRQLVQRKRPESPSKYLKPLEV